MGLVGPAHTGSCFCGGVLSRLNRRGPSPAATAGIRPRESERLRQNVATSRATSIRTLALLSQLHNLYRMVFLRTSRGLIHYVRVRDGAEQSQVADCASISLDSAFTWTIAQEAGCSQHRDSRSQCLGGVWTGRVVEEI